MLNTHTAPDGADGLEPENPVFCHGQFKLAMRLGRHKLIVPMPSRTLGRARRLRLWLKMLLQGELRDEIYDLAADPGETKNLVGNAGLRKSLRELLAGHLAASGLTSGAAVDLEDEQRKRIEKEMKDLGYM